jgi:Anti-sigma factor NepR
MVKETKKKRRAAQPGKKIEVMKAVSAKPEVSDLIADRLRKYYDAVAAQPVPDRFLDLLSQLEAASTAKKQD